MSAQSLIDKIRSATAPRSITPDILGETLQAILDSIPELPQIPADMSVRVSRLEAQMKTLSENLASLSMQLGNTNTAVATAQSTADSAKTLAQQALESPKCESSFADSAFLPFDSIITPDEQSSYSGGIYYIDNGEYGYFSVGENDFGLSDSDYNWKSNTAKHPIIGKLYICLLDGSLYRSDNMKLIPFVDGPLAMPLAE